MSNTKDVNHVIATVLSELYEAFPTRLNLYAKDLYVFENPEEEFNPIGDPPQDILNEAKKYNETIRWLEREDFIRVSHTNNYKSERGGGSYSEHIVFGGVVLTPKGFTILNSPSVLRVAAGGGAFLPITLMIKSIPLNLKDKVPRGQLISHVLQSGSTEYLRLLVNDIISTTIRDDQEV